MIDEALKNVLEAEAAADQTVENARLEAEKIRLEADARARATEDAVKKQVRLDVESKKAQAEENAQAEFRKEQVNCAKKIAALKNEKANAVEALAKEMVGRLLDGSC